jgi:transcriptional regulator GlxA family with amidase domain
VPGSEHPLGVLEDQALIDWLRGAAPNCEWTASVSSGAGLYAVAGLLEGKATNTHWGFRDYLRAPGVTVVEERVVWDGTHISCAGVSAGIDSSATSLYGRRQGSAQRSPARVCAGRVTRSRHGARHSGSFSRTASGASPYGAGPPFGLLAARRCQTGPVSACSRAKLPDELDNRFGSLGG